MTAKCQRQIVTVNAFAIVTHADQPHTAFLDLNINLARHGVDAVFQQFLEYGGRSFDHLAGGDLIGKFRGKTMDAHSRFQEGIIPARPHSLSAMSSGGKINGMYQLSEGINRR